MDEFFQNSAVDGNSEPVNEPVTEPVQQESFKTCERCNARLTPEQRFCPNCGKAVKNTNPSPHLVTEKKKKEHVISFVKSTLVLLLAVFVTIAAFLPLVDVGTEGYLEFSDDEIEMSIGFGAIDSIKTLVCSLDSLDEEEVEEIIEEIREEMEEYTEDWEDGEELDKLAYYGKKVINTYLRVEEYKPTTVSVAQGVLSILQIVLAILLVIFASLSFASFFTDKVKAFHGASLVLLGLTVALMLVNACTFKLSNMVSLAIGTMDIDMEFSTVQVCVTVFMLLLMAVFTVLRVTVDKRKITVGCFVKHALSIAFAVALLISVYAPVITTEVKAQFKNSETAKRETSSMTGGIFAYFDLSEYQEENFEYMLEENEIQEAVEWQFSRFENYTKREFAKGKGTAAEVNQSVFSYLLLGWGGYEYSDLYALGTVAMMIVILCAVLIIWKNIQEFATGKRLPSFVSVLTKLFAFLMVLTVVAEIIAMCIFVNYNAKTVDIIYKSSIAYGPILMSIFAVILACIPSAESKRN